MPYLSSRLSCCLLISASLLALASCHKPENFPGQMSSFETAARLKEQRDYAGAAALYRQILQHDPDSVETAIELASMTRKMGNPQQALMLMRSAQDKEPANTGVMTQLGYALIDSGQIKEAVAVFDRLMAMKHDDAAAYNGKAVAFDSAGNHIVAQKLYRQALTFAPGAANVQNNLAMSMILNGQVKEAAAILEPLYARHPTNATIRHNLAMAYGMTGNRTKSLELNMLDMSEAEAKENLKYYREYAKRQEPYIKPIITHHHERVRRESSSAVPVKAKAIEKKPEIKVAAKAEVKPEEAPEESLLAASPSSGMAESPSASAASSTTRRPQKSSFPTKHGEWSPDLFLP